MNESMLQAVLSLHHNRCLIDKAERILQEFADSKSCFLYLVNPDGTRVRIHCGCKIESYEIVPMIQESDEYD